MEKEIKISHISDTHGNKIKPNKNADIVVLSGDLSPHNLDNFTFLTSAGYAGGEREVNPKTGNWSFRRIDAEAEGEYQLDWHKKVTEPIFNKKEIEPSDVIWVNGNHDFCDVSSIFPNAVKKGTKNLTIKGVKFGVISGVNPLKYEWHDEVKDEVIGERIKEIDRDIDVLVTHAPPYHILDKSYGTEYIGSQAIYDAIFGLIGKEPYFNKLRFHLFGHAHESQGIEKHEFGGREIAFYNAANTRYDISLRV